MNIISNNGAAAGQAVFHLHIHVIPRFAEDRLLRFPKSSGMIEKDVALETLSAIQSQLQS